LDAGSAFRAGDIIDRLEAIMKHRKRRAAAALAGAAIATGAALCLVFTACGGSVAAGPTSPVVAAVTTATTQIATIADQAGDRQAQPEQPGGKKGPGAGSGQGQGGGNGQTPGGGNDQSQSGSQQYTIEQAISDRAQQNTIAFDALGFLTGSLGADSFFPPGKVADFWGFQYLRDNDSSQMGHNTDFLTSASMNMLTVLTGEQRQKLIALATSQVPSIQEYGYRRFVLMEGFRRLLNGDLPSGTTGLSEDAVKAFSAELYQLDGRISFERAQVMGPILSALTAEQKTYLDGMVGKGMSSWPKVDEPPELKGLSRDQKEAVMTYAGDMFSWYAGSVDADVYFCPERQGTYFGSFYLKDAPAVGNPGYSIATNITGDLGAALVAKLDDKQARLITGLVDVQKPYLTQIVDTRRSVATELRQYLSGGSADQNVVSGLMKTYGELDGSIVYNLAVNFAQVGRSLTAAEKTALGALRTQLLGDLSLPAGAYLYSTPIPMPEIPNTDFLFK
jgi:hypothetical protein